MHMYIVRSHNFINFFLVFYFTVLDEGDIEILKTYVSLILYLYRCSSVPTHRSVKYARKLDIDQHISQQFIVLIDHVSSTLMERSITILRIFYLTVFMWNYLTLLCFCGMTWLYCGTILIIERSDRIIMYLEELGIFVLFDRVLVCIADL